MCSTYYIHLKGILKTEVWSSTFILSCFLRWILCWLKLFLIACMNSVFHHFDRMCKQRSGHLLFSHWKAFSSSTCLLSERKQPEPLHCGKRFVMLHKPVQQDTAWIEIPLINPQHISHRNSEWKYCLMTVWRSCLSHWFYYCEVLSPGLLHT